MLRGATSELPSRLQYDAGNENSPGNPFGRTELIIDADGHARLVHRRIGSVRSWTGKVLAATLSELWEALGRGGFPDVPQHPIPGGAAMRTLVAQVGDRKLGASVAWHAAKSLPGYSEAFPILDSIVRQLSEDTVKTAPNTLPPVVSDIVAETAPGNVS